jgi:hypothetical protein
MSTKKVILACQQALGVTAEHMQGLAGVVEDEFKAIKKNYFSACSRRTRTRAATRRPSARCRRRGRRCATSTTRAAWPAGASSACAIAHCPS